MDQNMIIGIAIGALFVWIVLPRVLPLAAGVLGKGE